MNTFRIVLPALLVAAAAGAAHSPYQGEEARDIKALSKQETAGLLAGEGLGFARAAELNHYPGPRHVLDLADELRLSAQQLQATQAIFRRMRAEAVALGRELVARERALDELFAAGTVSRENLEPALSAAGAVRARLRGVHLRAHLEQKEVLTPRQVRRYDTLRGYAREGVSHDAHSHREHD